MRLHNAEEEAEETAEAFDSPADLHESLIICITASSRVRATVRMALVCLEYRLPNVRESIVSIEDLQADFDLLDERAYWAKRNDTVDGVPSLSICFPFVYFACCSVIVECSIASKDLAIPRSTHDKYELQKNRASLSQRRLWCLNESERKWRKLPWLHRSTIDTQDEVDELLQTLSLQAPSDVSRDYLTA